MYEMRLLNNEIFSVKIFIFQWFNIYPFCTLPFTFNTSLDSNISIGRNSVGKSFSCNVFTPQSFVFTALIDSKCVSLNALFCSFENSQKSHGARFGEYGGCWSTDVQFLSIYIPRVVFSQFRSRSSYSFSERFRGLR